MARECVDVFVYHCLFQTLAGARSLWLCTLLPRPNPSSALHVIIPQARAVGPSPANLPSVCGGRAPSTCFECWSCLWPPSDDPSPHVSRPYSYACLLQHANIFHHGRHGVHAQVCALPGHGKATPLLDISPIQPLTCISRLVSHSQYVRIDETPLRPPTKLANTPPRR